MTNGTKVLRLGVIAALLASLLSTGVASMALAAGPAAKLAFGTQPTSAAAGAAIPSFTVQILDSSNALTTSTANVTVAISSNPVGGVLSGTATVAAVNGVATFTGLSIDKAGVGYTLAATSSGLTGTTSAAFGITGPAAKLAFGTQPTTAAAGAAIPSFTVQVEDVLGSVVASSSASISLALLSNPGGGTLSGTATVAAVNGVATFTGLSINNAGVGYTLVATSSGLTGTTSAAFGITGSAAKLAYGTQPSAAGTGASIPAFTVQVEDANGSVVTSSAASVTVAIANNPGSGTLSGTATVAAVNGVATFTGLSINNAGVGYTLAATSSGLTGTTSAAFNIAGGAAKLAFGTQPSTAVALTTMPAFTVQVEDANGSVVTSSAASVTVAIANNPVGGVLSGTKTVAAVNGVATFTGVSIDKAASGYTLVASSSGLTGATSSAFTVTSANNHLVFVTQPGGGAAGAVWSQQPVVAVENTLGQVVTTDSSTLVALSISYNPAGGTLSCTGGTTEQAVNGYAYFSGCSISVASSSYYTLAATSSPVWTPATSASFLVGSSTQLVFVTQPGGGAAGAVWSQQPVVAVENTLGQVVTTDSSTLVALSISYNPAGGTLSCTGGTTEQAVNGYAYFSGCSISVASSSYYTLAATSSPVWTPATSASFLVGSSTQLVFVTQPGGGAAGAVWSQQPVVAVENSINQVATTDSSTLVTLSISYNPAGGTLSCTGGTTKQAVNGYAYFSGCSISVASSSYYTLAATSSPVWTPATSASFLVGSSTQTFTTGTALGRTTVGPFTSTSKIQAAGRYITWKMDGGPTAAGMTIQIWVYRKYSVTGRWTSASLLTTRVANSSGVAYATIISGGNLWLSVRPVMPATATMPALWGPTSIGRWIK